VQALKPTPMPCLTLLASWRSKRNHVGGETSDRPFSKELTGADRRARRLDRI